MVISIRPVLISEKQVKAMKEIQEGQRRRSEVGVVPTIHEVTRGLMDKALAYILTGRG